MLLSLVVLACGDKIPITEMTQARSAISRAESVRAEKYAPKEFEEAKAKLLECHDLIVREEFSDAKEAAEQSGALAREAYDKSLPLLAKDTLDSAEKSLEDAEEAYAEKLAPEEYSGAKRDFDSAGTLFQEKQFYPSYKKALDADAEAKNARSVALGKKSALQESIDEVRHVLREAENYDAKTHAPEKYEQASSHLEAANTAYGAQELKKGYSEVAVAKINADEAYLIASEATAKSRLAQAGVAVEKAERVSFPAAKDDVVAAREYYSRAKTSLGEEKFKESIDSSDEAIRIATVAMGMKEAADENIALSGREEGDTEESGGDQVSSESSDYTLYTVKYRRHSRDCLWRISGRFYRNPRLWRKIYDANKDRVSNPDFILPGWVLKIPKN